MSKQGTGKAYKVEDPYDDEGRAVVVFAHTANQARRYGMGLLDHCDYIALRARRAPEFDGHYGDDLLRQQLRMGWWFGCHSFHCRREVREDRDWDEGRSDSGYVVRDGEVFCSATCCLTELRRRRQKREDEWHAIARAVEAWPGSAILGLFRNTAGEWICTVHHSGAEYPVTTVIP